MMKPLVFIFKSTVTFLGIGVLLYFVDWQVLWDTLTRVDPSMLILVTGIILFNLWLCSLKWMLLSNIISHSYKLRQFYKAYLVSSFFNNFFPSTVGGDTFRGFDFYKNNDVSKSEAAVPIVVDRITGLLILCGLGGLCALWLAIKQPDELSQSTLLVGVIGVFTASVFYIIIRLSKLSILSTKLAAVVNVLNQFKTYIKLYKSQPNVFSAAIVVGISFHLIVFFSRLILYLSLGVEVDFFHIGMVTMLSTLLATLPISLNGIGVLEVSFAFFMTYYNIPYEESVAVVLINRFLLMTTTLVGGMVWLLSSDKKTKKAKAF